MRTCERSHLQSSFFLAVVAGGIAGAGDRGARPPGGSGAETGMFSSAPKDGGEKGACVLSSSMHRSAGEV